MVAHVLQIVGITLISLVSNGSAFILGAGSCGEGVTGIQNSVGGNVHVSAVNGPLADAGVTLTINGIVIAADTPTNFPAGTDLEWTVTAAQTPFKGIFIRVASEGEFTHVGDPALVDDAMSCDAIEGVAGLDHITNTEKTSVTGTTNFDIGGAAIIDITVVFGFSRWAFSAFSLTIDQVVAPTSAPITSAPVDLPVTSAPIDVPVTLAPVEVPVDAPVTTAPVEVPVDAPVTAAPVEVPVEAPLSPAPVEVPVTEAPTTLLPVPAPISETTDTPTVGPTVIAPSPVSSPPVKEPTGGMGMGMKKGDMGMKRKDNEGMIQKVMGGGGGDDETSPGVKKGMKRMNKKRRHHLRA